jgi:uncharacterized membrane protein SpoIIM required for sporulation
MMNPDQFYKSRRADWKSLSDLLDKSHNGIHALSSGEIDRLGALYRAITSDLALAQRDFPRDKVTAYLNQLVARAHAVVYRGEPVALKRLLRFATQGFPRAYRQALPFILAAALLFILPGLAAGLGAAWRPESALWLLPEEVHHLIDDIEDQNLWTDIPVNERSYTSSFVMQNNIQVAILAFGSGVLAGLPAAWLMLYNGLLIGGISGLTAHYGVGFELWTFVIGHGVIELSTIFIAGGSGLMLGWSILQPGLLRRRDALAQAARRSVRLVVGCVPLLVLAGLIEGLISPAETIPWPIKWGIGLGSGLLLYAYLLGAGHNP